MLRTPIIHVLVVQSLHHVLSLGSVSRDQQLIREPHPLWDGVVALLQTPNAGRDVVSSQRASAGVCHLI